MRSARGLTGYPWGTIAVLDGYSLALTRPPCSIAPMSSAETWKRLATITLVPTAMFVTAFAAAFVALWATMQLV